MSPFKCKIKLKEKKGHNYILYYIQAGKQWHDADVKRLQ